MAESRKFSNTAEAVFVFVFVCTAVLSCFGQEIPKPSEGVYEEVFGLLKRALQPK